MSQLILTGHHLCPYVQRAVISLSEKAVPFERIDVDLANKPNWFIAISPLGKTPVLKVGERAIFESTAILEYLEETKPNPLHPSDPLTRAEHRAWIEFGSSVLTDIWGFYAAADGAALENKARALGGKFARLERCLSEGPYFEGGRFSLVDAVFGPVFRYFDAFDRIADFRILAETPRVNKWRRALAARPSIQGAVANNFQQRLWTFLEGRNSQLSRLMRDKDTPILPPGANAISRSE